VSSWWKDEARLFGVRFDDLDIVPENFQSMRALTNFIESKRAQK